MKLTALAVVILALGIVLGLALRGTTTEAAPRWATPQFVDDSIEAFNQAVVQPIADAVAQLQGDVNELDQRVTELEAADGATSVVTDRAFLRRSGLNDHDLVDTDDGSLIATYPGLFPVHDGSNCDNTRAFLRDSSNEQFTLIDTSDGQVLGVYAPPFSNVDGTVSSTEFSCTNLDWLNSGLEVVANRVAIGWQDNDSIAKSTLLVDTDTGQAIASFPGAVISGYFNCIGDRLLITSVGIIDSLSGAIITPFDGVFSDSAFMCR